jgi:hypothetical protein
MSNVDHAARRSIRARYDEGQPLHTFTPAERAVLRADILASDAYNNAKHPDSAMLKADAAVLYSMDYPEGSEEPLGWQLESNLRAAGGRLGG